MPDNDTGSSKRGRSVRGGSIATGGFNYQHRVAAWSAVLMLAEQGADLPWDLPSATSFSFLQCETGQPIDDQLIGTTGGGFVFFQVKRTLSLSPHPDSELASALDQIVRQFVAYREQPGQRPWERPLPLDHACDRLVLVTGPDSPQTVRVHLASVLNRIRQLVPGQSIHDAPANAQQKSVLATILTHIEQAWLAACGSSPINNELQNLLKLTYLQVLDVDLAGSAEREAKQILRSSVIRDAEQVDLAWSHLIKICAEFAASQSGVDRTQLQQHLLNVGIALRISRSYETDVEHLKDQTTQTIHLLTHLSRLRIGGVRVKIRRPCVVALEEISLVDSLVVVGEPGAGKPGALYDLVVSLLDKRHDVVFLAAEHLSAGSYRELGRELGLKHDLIDVLTHWPGTAPALLVLDALDAARSSSIEQALHDLIRLVIDSQGRWRVVVSIRKFDLRFNRTLKQLFAGTPPTTWRDPEFERIRHLNIPQLTDDELAQIPTQSSELGSLIGQVVPALRDLLPVPFNIRLIAELLGEGFAVKELTPIHTQLELLDRYWWHRLLTNDGQADAREAILRDVCEVMIQTRALRADRSRIASVTTSAPLASLLHNHVLIEWQAPQRPMSNREVLTFSHHVLFDYAVARLLLRGDPRQIVERIKREPDLVLMIQPSFVLHFRDLWIKDEAHQSFWDLVLHMVTQPNVPHVAKLIGPSIAAESAMILGDLAPLLHALNDADETMRMRAEAVFRSIIGALIAGRGVMVGAEAGPWCALLECVTQRLQFVTIYAIRALLSTICDQPERLTPEQRNNAGISARRLLEFAWAQTLRDSQLVIPAMQCVCRTFESGPQASGSLLRRCFEPSQLTEHGFEEIPLLAREVTRLMPIEPEFVTTVYMAAFAYVERSTEQTPIGTSRILALTSTRSQDYNLAQYVLGEAFSEFLTTAPLQALLTLIAVIEAYARGNHTSSDESQYSFEFDGQEARIVPDYSSIWDGNGRQVEGAPKMLHAFALYLADVSRDEAKIEHLRELGSVDISA